jgi:hypothetical protein
VHFSTSESRWSRPSARGSFSYFIQHSVLAFSRVIGAEDDGAAATAAVLVAATGAVWATPVSVWVQAETAIAAASANVMVKRLPERRMRIDQFPYSRPACVTLATTAIDGNQAYSQRLSNSAELQWRTIPRHFDGHDGVFIRELNGVCRVFLGNNTILEARMRLSWAVAATAALILWSATSGAVKANPVEEEDHLAVGVGVICNTSEQMKRLVGLRMDGAEVPRAVSTVNDEVRDSHACGVAAVAFMSDKMVDIKNVEGKMVQIVRINVIATFDGDRWSRVPVMTQYALIESEGYPI